jgi:alpha-beta hydrolase superfamily lysophospholipase
MNEKSILRREGNFNGQEGFELFYQSWSQASENKTPLPTLVLTHGMAEHSECYSKTATHFAKLGWNVCAWDLRGHGRSEGKRGFVTNFSDYVLDLGAFLRHLKNTGRLSERFALIGHSMGGLITLRYLADCSLGLAPTASPMPLLMTLSSPQLGIALQVPAIKDMAARIFHRVMPSLTLNNEIKYEDLTHDEEFLKTYPGDALRHDKISPGVYLGMLEHIDFVMKNASAIQLPTLVQAAGNDKIVSLPATKEFFTRLGSPNKQLIVYDESYHEIFNDLDRERVFSDLQKFLVSIF